MKTAAALLSLFIFAGCASPAHLKREDSQLVVETARQIALKEPSLSQKEKSEIQNSEPKLSYYFIAKPIAHYFISWNLSSNREVMISGTGDIFTLAESKTSFTYK